MDFAGKNGGMMNTGEYWAAISDELGSRDRGENSGEGQVSADAVKDLGVEVLDAVARETESDERASKSGEQGREAGEQASEEERQVREEFDKWYEGMAGSLDGYWQKLEGKWWAEEQAPLSEYETPKYGLLRLNAKKFIRKQMPELTVAGAEARAEMATKVALQRLAEEEARMLKTAKTGFFGGELKLAKGWNESLLTAANTGMGRDLEKIYGEGTERPSGDDLSERELVAWWAASEPESEWPKRALELLEAAKGEDELGPEAVTEDVEDAEEVDEPESVAEGDKKPIIRMNSEDMEIVSVPEPLVNTAMVEKEQAEDDGPVAEAVERESLIRKILRGLPVIGRSFSDHVDKAIVEAAMAALNVGTGLVPVVETEVVIEQPDGSKVEKQETGAEGLGQSEMMEQSIAMVGRTIQMLEQQMALLEDYNPVKADMTRDLNEAKLILLRLQSAYEANRGDFEEGKRQRAAGLENDKIDVGQSEGFRRWEMAVELLIASGMLKREDSPETNLGVVRGLQVKLREEYDNATRRLKIEQDNYIEYLKALLDAESHFERLVAEANERAKMEDDDKIVEFPSLDALRKVKK